MNLVRGSLLLIVIATTPAATLAQTRELIDAPRIDARIRLRWDESSGKLTFAKDEETTFRPVPPKALFLTRAGVRLTYPRLNPFRVLVTAGPADADDPARPVVARLLGALINSALVGIPAEPPGNIGGGPGTARPLAIGTTDCPAAQSARADVSSLAQALFDDASGRVTAGRALDRWRGSIDAAYAAGRGGRDAVQTAVDQISQFLAALSANLDAAGRLLDSAERQAASGGGGEACARETHAIYQSVLAANPRARYRQLVWLRSLVTDLRQALLQSYVEPAGARWIGAEYHIGAEILPGTDEAEHIVVKVVDIEFTVDGETGGLRSTDQVDRTFSLGIRRFARFAREVGAGTVIGSLTRPRYGTTRNAVGETTVARMDDGAVSVNPAFLFDLVCLCNMGPVVAPMAQVGVSTSKDVPAILGGGGARLFSAGKGDVAIGAGWMLGWIKDLRKLKAHDVVGGTADIEQDLGFKRRHGWYLVLQYQF